MDLQDEKKDKKEESEKLYFESPSIPVLEKEPIKKNDTQDKKKEALAKLIKYFESRGIPVLEKEPEDKQALEKILAEKKLREVGIEEKVEEAKVEKAEKSETERKDVGSEKQFGEIAKQLTPKEIAEKYNISLRTTYRKLNQLGIKPKKQTIYIEKDELIQTLKKYTLREAAEKLRVSRSTVERFARQYGIKKRELKELIFSKEELINYIKGGKSVGEIAKLKNVARTTVENYIYKIYHIKVSDYKPEIISKEELEALLNKGYTITQIANIKGVGRKTIRMRIKKWGLEKRKEPPFKDESELIELLKEHKSIFKIARLKRIGCNTVKAYLAKHNIDAKKIIQAAKEEEERRYLSRERLYDCRVKRGMSIENIAKELHKSKSTIKKYLELYGIDKEKRLYEDEGHVKANKQEGLEVKVKKQETKKIRRKGLSPELIQKLQGYIESNYSLKDIATELGCYPSTVSRWVKKPSLYRLIELKKKEEEEKLVSIIREYYIDKDYSMRKIEEELDIPRRIVAKFADKYGWYELKELKKRKRDEERKNLILAEIEKGTKLEDIGKLLGLKRGRVQYLLEKYGIKYERKPVKKQEISRDELWSDYIEQRLSIEKIARKRHKSKKIIRRLISEYALDKEKEQREREKMEREKERLHELREKGYSIITIEKILGMPRNTVLEKLIRYRIYQSFKCRGKPIDEQLLRDLYVYRMLPSRQIGEIVGRDKSVVLRYVKKYGLDKEREMLKDGLAYLINYFML
jgi:AraC-like DNA-binding protein